MVIGGVVLGAGLLSLMVLTGLGEHRRGAGRPLVVLAGIFFPLTWFAWYVKDELPGRAQRHHAA